jgi:transposase
VAREGVAGSKVYPNTERGYRDLVKDLKEAQLIVLEATGGYERGVVASLGGAGLPVVVVNPRQVRDFAKATGQLAKTDQLDAHVLAAFAATVKPELRSLPSAEEEELRDFLTRQQQVMQMLVAEKSRLLQAQGKGRQALRRQIKSHISYI